MAKKTSKKISKKKSSKKKISKKKISKKKISKKISSKGKFRKLTEKEYNLIWDDSMSRCNYQSGEFRGPTSLGVTDQVVAVTDGNRHYLCSISKVHGYVCVECFDKHGLAKLCYADKNDINNMFGAPATEVEPVRIIRRLA